MRESLILLHHLLVCLRAIEISAFGFIMVLMLLILTCMYMFMYIHVCCVLTCALACIGCSTQPGQLSLVLEDSELYILGYITVCTIKVLYG